MKKLLCLLCVAVAAGLLSSSARAMAPIGVPAASLDSLQFAAGIGFSRSVMDVEFEILGINVTSEDNELETYMANLIWGLDKSWEFQIDLGLSEAEYEDGSSSSGDFACGFGLKTTWVERGKLKVGSAVTLHFYESHTSGYDLGVLWSEENDWIELKIAVGPSYDFGSVCLYGGPFLHFIDGQADVTISGFEFSDDFEQDDIFGGFAGAQFDLSETSSAFIEYQMTGSASAIAGGIVWRF